MKEQRPFISPEILEEIAKTIEEGVDTEAYEQLKLSEPELVEWLTKHQSLRVDTVITLVYKAMLAVMERS